MSFDLSITNGDLVIGTDGDLKKVQDNEKLIQDILKIAATQSGSNPFFPWYGSPLSKTIIGGIFPIGMTDVLASDQLRSSLALLQKLQGIQVQKGQRVSPGELLAAVRNVGVLRNRIDPRHFRVTIDVVTKALTPLTTGFDITL